MYFQIRITALDIFLYNDILDNYIFWTVYTMI
jgi:hypothetical protein